MIPTNNTTQLEPIKKSLNLDVHCSFQKINVKNY